MADMIRRTLSPVRARNPELVFCFYPYHHYNMWQTRAALAGTSTRRAPSIPWDDHTYWTGWTGKPQHVETTRTDVIDYLGYEPFYVCSIDFASAPRYPSYTPDRAGREFYLLNRAATGMIAYADSRNHREDLLENQRAYFTEGFAKAHRPLAADGVIDQAAPKPAAGAKKAKLQRALEMLHSEIGDMWFSVHGEAYRHVDNPVSAPFDGAPLTVDKTLEQSRIYNMTAADYVFELELKRRPETAALTVHGTPRRNQGERTNLLVKVNGQKVGLARKAFNREKPVRVTIPANLITHNTVVTLAYFLGDSYEETRWDNSVTVKRLELTLE